MQPDNRKDYYEILGVPPNATEDQIKQAWRFHAQAFHPDKFPESQRKSAEERMKAVNDAYDVLSNPFKKTDYDQKRARQARAESAGASHSSPPSAPRPHPPTGRPTASLARKPPASALNLCPFCRKQVDRFATVCPHCRKNIGLYNLQRREPQAFNAGIVAAFAALALGYVIHKKLIDDCFKVAASCGCCINAAIWPILILLLYGVVGFWVGFTGYKALKG